MENEPAVHVELWRAFGLPHTVLPTRPAGIELRSLSLQSGQGAAALSAYLYNGINVRGPWQSRLCRLSDGQPASIRSANTDCVTDEYKSCWNFRSGHRGFRRSE